MKVQWLIKIGSIYLTDDGLVGGSRYLSEVEGIPEVQATTREIKKVDFRGIPFFNTVTVGQGNKVITIRCTGLLFALVSDIEAAKRAHKTAGTPITLTGTHPYDSDFDFDLNVNFDSIEYTDYLSTQYRDVVMRFTSFDEVS